MKQIFDQFLNFLQQGIAAIFRFVQLVWNWSMDQITRMAQAPWGEWPLWKQLLLVIVIVAVAYALFIAARQLWVAGTQVLAAFASFLVALVVTLPAILIAGCIAVVGLWVINNFNPASLPTLTVFERSTPEPANDRNRPPRETTGQGASDTTGTSR
jgi:hypothetical protein